MNERTAARLETGTAAEDSAAAKPTEVSRIHPTGGTDRKGRAVGRSVDRRVRVLPPEAAT